MTWTNYGVVAYDPTKSKGAYRENMILPVTGKPAKYYNRHTNRAYAFRGLYIPSRTVIPPVKPSKPGKTIPPKSELNYLDGIN